MPVKQSDRPAETKSSVEALIEAFCKTGMKQVKEDLNVPRCTFDHADIRHQASRTVNILLKTCYTQGLSQCKTLCAVISAGSSLLAPENSPTWTITVFCAKLARKLVGTGKSIGKLQSLEDVDAWRHTHVGLIRQVRTR